MVKLNYEFGVSIDFTSSFLIESRYAKSDLCVNQVFKISSSGPSYKILKFSGDGPKALHIFRGPIPRLVIFEILGLKAFFKNFGQEEMNCINFGFDRYPYFISFRLRIKSIDIKICETPNFSKILEFL